MTDQNKEFLQKLLTTFRSEAQEHLQEIISHIVLLEQASDDRAQRDLVDRILRKLHTLKGAARAVDQNELENLCHTLESVFTIIGRANFSLALKQYDLLHQAGSLAQALVQEPSGRIRNQVRALIVRLEHAIDELSRSARHNSEAHKSPDLQPPTGSDMEEAERVGDAVPDFPQADVMRVQGRHLDAIRHHSEALLSVELSLQHHIDGLLGLAEEMSQYQVSQSQGLQRLDDRAITKRHAKKTERFPRQDSHWLGSVPEALAPGKRSLEQRCRHLAEGLGRTRRNFQLIRSHLMEANLDAALVPVSSGLESLPALARNLARSQEKEVALRIEGGSIQIDRRILDIVREALIHLVTNSIDHGIEAVSVRRANNKQPAGKVWISVAQPNANQILVTVADDGAGINVDALMAAARNRNLHGNPLADLSEQQKLELALLAGVSTSPALTSVSGRGVGLAIVAEKVTSVGGELTVENSPKAGCTFRLMLPVRLSTMRGLVVRVDGVLYVLPLSGIASVRSLKEGDIQTVENRETLVVGDQVIPVLRLGALLRHQSFRDEAAAGQDVAVVARSAGKCFALPMDEIFAEQEVLPKSLGKQLRRVRYITGATQLTDGSLVPILGLEDIAKFGLSVADNPVREKKAATKDSILKRVLVAEDSITSRLLLKHILESAGYQVETAVDGLDALSRLRNQDFDVLISDIEMPRMDGLALTQSIRANPETPDLPVVLVTSLQSAEEKERGLRAGADAYVVKGSFDQDNLLATIRRLI